MIADRLVALQYLCADTGESLSRFWRKNNDGWFLMLPNPPAPGTRAGDTAALAGIPNAEVG